MLVKAKNIIKLTFRFPKFLSTNQFMALIASLDIVNL